MTLKRRLKKSPLKLGWGFIGLVLGLLILGWLGNLWHLSLWRGHGDFSWIKLDDGQLELMTIIPEYNKLITWKIPGNTLVDTAFNYGRYQWKNVYDLGQLDGRGGRLLARTTQEALGIPVNAWQIGRDGNLSWWDKFKWWYWTKFRIKQHLVLDLAQSGIMEAEVLKDGSQAWSLSIHRVDQLVNRETFSQAVDREAISVSLVNEVNLYRVIVNHGVEVPEVSRQANVPEQTEIIIDERSRAESETVKWIRRLLPQAKLREARLPDYQTPVVIILGKDYNN